MKSLLPTLNAAVSPIRQAMRPVVRVLSGTTHSSKRYSSSGSTTPASYIYGVPTPAQGGPSKPPIIQQRPIEATTSTPTNLAPEQRKLLEETIRVDHIGEAAANWIYQATKFVSEVKGDKKTAQQVEVSSPAPDLIPGSTFSYQMASTYSSCRKCGQQSVIT